MQVQHILVPHDFSPHADRAVAYAIILATKLQAQVTLMHAINPIMLSAGSTDIDAAVDPFIEELETSAHQAIQDAAQIAGHAGVRCDTVVVFGTPFQEILNFASHHQIDLIVMGSHGRTGLLHTLLGSVAERVIRLASCPVLVVRHEEKEDFL